MEIVVKVVDPTPEFQEKLLALLGEHAVERDTEWTIERALRYYRALRPRAQKILKEAVTRGGFVPADALRGDENDSLRGHSGAFKRVLDRGTREGWWPTDMKAPVEPQGPGFGKVQGYRVPDGLLHVFKLAVAAA